VRWTWHQTSKKIANPSPPIHHLHLILLLQSSLALFLQGKSTFCLLVPQCSNLSLSVAAEKNPCHFPSSNCSCETPMPRNLSQLLSPVTFQPSPSSSDHNWFPYNKHLLSFFWSSTLYHHHFPFSILQSKIISLLRKQKWVCGNWVFWGFFVPILSLQLVLWSWAGTNQLKEFQVFFFFADFCILVSSFCLALRWLWSINYGYVWCWFWPHCIAVLSVVSLVTLNKFD